MKSKEDSKIAVHEAGGSLNYIKIDEKNVEVIGSKLGKPKINLFNHEKELTIDYEKLKQNDDSRNTAKIDLIFRIKANSKLLWEHSEEKLIHYHFTKHHNDSELKQVTKEAETNYLFELISNGEEFHLSNSIKCIIRNINGILELELIDKVGTGNTIKIRNSNITLDFRYFLVNEYKLSDVYNPTWPSPKKDEKYWTTKKIIAAVLLLAIISIVIFFREKIWKWIKGETKQEEKIRKQLDIF